MRRTRASTAPEFSSPLLSTRTQATVITAGWPNPRNASRDGTSPASTQASRAPAATMSCRQRPHRNIATVAARMPRMRSCSVVSAHLRLLAQPLFRASQGLSPSLPPGVPVRIPAGIGDLHTLLPEFPDDRIVELALADPGAVDVVPGPHPEVQHDGAVGVFLEMARQMIRRLSFAVRIPKRTRTDAATIRFPIVTDDCPSVIRGTSREARMSVNVSMGRLEGEG